MDIDEIMDRLFEDRPGHNHFHLNQQGEPVLSKNLREWGEFTEKDPKQSGRIVKQERIGHYWISTVFLMLDHSWGEGPPVLWETMVFTDRESHPLNSQQDRCSGSREQAMAMHEKMTHLIRTAGTYDDDPARDYILVAYEWVKARVNRYRVERMAKQYRAAQK